VEKSDTILLNVDLKRIIKIGTKNIITRTKIKGSMSLNTEVKEEYKDEHMNHFFEDYNDSYIESM